MDNNYKGRGGLSRQHRSKREVRYVATTKHIFTMYTITVNTLKV